MFILYIHCQYIYHGSNISSTENDFNIRIDKAWTAIDRWLTIRKFDFSDKIKRLFFQAVAVLVILYSCTIWKSWGLLRKNVVLNKLWKQQPAKEHLYSLLHLITKTIRIRRERLAGEVWTNRLLWTPTHGHTRVDRTVKFILINSVRTLDTFERNNHKQWPMKTGKEREREREKDDDDDDDLIA